MKWFIRIMLDVVLDIPFSLAMVRVAHYDLPIALCITIPFAVVVGLAVGVVTQ
jgi:hypothetical protein